MATFPGSPGRAVGGAGILWFSVHGFACRLCVPTGGAGLKKETARVLDNRQSCDRHHIARQKRPLFSAASISSQALAFSA